MRIRIQILLPIKVMRIYDHWSTEYRPSKAPLGASTPPRLYFKPLMLLNFLFNVYPNQIQNNAVSCAVLRIRIRIRIRSTGYTCFWASRIRIHKSEVWIRLWIRSRILLLSCRNSEKNLDSYYFVTHFDFLSLKNGVNLASKSNKQKKLC